MQTAHDHGPISCSEALVISGRLRGVEEVRVRFLSDAHELEAALVDLLLEMGVSVLTERICNIAPRPGVRFSFRYTGRIAVLTVTPDAWSSF